MAQRYVSHNIRASDSIEDKKKKENNKQILDVLCRWAKVGHASVYSNR